MAEAILNPTPDQTFRIEGRGDYDFSRTLRLSDEAQRRGAVDEACNLRFHAFQHLADLIPDNEEVILEWEHPNTQAALHLLYRSAVDHFLIDDFELSAAMLEFLLDLDPEDHEEATMAAGLRLRGAGRLRRLRRGHQRRLGQIPRKAAADALVGVSAPRVAARRRGDPAAQPLRTLL